jgi:ADP-ribose pyrophosphatase
MPDIWRSIAQLVIGFSSDNLRGRAQRRDAALPDIAGNRPEPNVEILEEHDVLREQIFTVRKARLRFRMLGEDRTLSGTMSDVVERVDAGRGDSVSAVVVNVATREVVLVEQFKYPTLRHESGWITELVVGMVDPHGTPEEAIRREIGEEIGYDLRAVERISTSYASPAGSSERITLFYSEIDDALRSGRGGGKAAEGEDIALGTLPLDRVPEAIGRGENADAKTIGGLLWLQLRMEQNR